jgi:hypothetical protein
MLTNSNFGVVRADKNNNTLCLGERTGKRFKTRKFLPVGKMARTSQPARKIRKRKKDIYNI